MATLSKQSITDYLNQGQLLKEYEISHLQGASYDLRIGTIFQGGKIISFTDEKEANTIVTLQPSEIVTMLTKESVELPLNIHATVFAINKNSSSGLLILNPGHIDPGFKGPITICAINLSKDQMVLAVDRKIFTIIFHDTTTACPPYEKNFGGTRREREVEFLTNNSMKLSKSIFDSMASNENVPILKKMVNDMVHERLLKIGGLLVGAATTIFAIVKGVDTMRDSKVIDAFLHRQHTTTDSTRANAPDTATYRHETVAQ